MGQSGFMVKTRNLPPLLSFSALLVCILPHCRLRDWCGILRKASGHVVCRLDQSASFRIFDSTFYFPHSAIPHFTQGYVPKALEYIFRPSTAYPCTQTLFLWVNRVCFSLTGGRGRSENVVLTCLLFSVALDVFFDVIIYISGYFDSSPNDVVAESCQIYV